MSGIVSRKECSDNGSKPKVVRTDTSVAIVKHFTMLFSKIKKNNLTWQNTM